MFNRRRFLQTKLSLPAIGAWFSTRKGAAASVKRDFFKELGVKEFINAAEPFTALSGSLMPPGIMEAMQ